MTVFAKKDEKKPQFVKYNKIKDEWIFALFDYLGQITYKGCFSLNRARVGLFLTKLVASVFDLANYNASILLNVTSVKNASVKTKKTQTFICFK